MPRIRRCRAAAARKLSPPQRSVTDDAGAEERRGRFVGVPGRQAVGVRLVDDGPLAEAAVGVEAGEFGVFAEILQPRRHHRHRPHVCRSHAIPTRSPIANRSHWSPTASTSPRSHDRARCRGGAERRHLLRDADRFGTPRTPEPSPGSLGDPHRARPGQHGVGDRKRWVPESRLPMRAS